jgi:hypothetical protein
VVRSHYHNYGNDNSNEAAKCRSVTATGISLLGRDAALRGPDGKAPSVFSQKAGLPLLAPHPSRPRALLCPAGVCVLRFSPTTNDVAKSALSKSCRAR